MGRSSIFIINTIIALNCFLLLMIYLIIFGNTASSILTDIFPSVTDGAAHFFMSKPFYVIVIAVINVPLILMRAIKELKIASFFLFGSIILFVVIFIVQIIQKGTYLNPDSDYKQYYEIKINFNLITSISVMFTAYGFQTNIWCTYTSLKVKNNANAMKSIYGAIFLTMAIYFVTSVVSIYMFGSSIMPSILDNVGLEKGTW